MQPEQEENRAGTVRVAVAFGMCSFQAWALPVACGPVLDGFSFGWRAAAAIGALGILLLASRWVASHIGCFDSRRAAEAVSLLNILGATGLIGGMAISQAGVVWAGFVLYAVALAGAFFLTALAAAAMTPRQRLHALVGGFSVQVVVASACLGCSAADPWVSIAFGAVGLPVACVAAARLAHFDLCKISAVGDMSNVGVENPSAFLPFSHRLFVMILMFSCLSGYGYTIVARGFVHGAPAPLMALAAGTFLVVLAALLVGRRGAPSVDDVFYLSLVVTVVGFCAGIIPDWSGEQLWMVTVGFALLLVGAHCFSLFLWVLLFDLTARNIFASLRLAVFGVVAVLVGMAIDAGLWALANVLASVGEVPPNLVAILFFGLCVAGFFLLLREYSFEGTVRAFPSVAMVQVRSDDGGIEERCESMATAFRLTARERDVFGLLARGRNIRYIEEVLVVSKNTVRTHTRNIYTKLDVHSHQELIDKVDAWVMPQ